MAEQERDCEQTVSQVTKGGGWNSEEEWLQYYRARTQQAQELRRAHRRRQSAEKIEAAKELIERLKAEGHYDKLPDRCKIFLNDLARR